MHDRHRHHFECDDAPGSFRCACGWWAHVNSYVDEAGFYQRDDDRPYCIHPVNTDEEAFLVSGWNDVLIEERSL